MAKNCNDNKKVSVEQFLKIPSLNVGIKEYFMGFDLADVYPNNLADQVTYERGRLFAAYLKSRNYKYNDFYFNNGKHIKSKFNELARAYYMYGQKRLSI